MLYKMFYIHIRRLFLLFAQHISYKICRNYFIYSVIKI
jgi:hypothetical protein